MAYRYSGPPIRLDVKDLAELQRKADAATTDRSDWLRSAIASWPHTPDQTRFLALAVSVKTMELPVWQRPAHGRFRFSYTGAESRDLQERARHAGISVPEYVRAVIWHAV